MSDNYGGLKPFVDRFCEVIDFVSYLNSIFNNSHVVSFKSGDSGIAECYIFEPRFTCFDRYELDKFATAAVVSRLVRSCDNHVLNGMQEFFDALEMLNYPYVSKNGMLYMELYFCILLGIQKVENRSWKFSGCK